MYVEYRWGGNIQLLPELCMTYAIGRHLLEIKCTSIYVCMYFECKLCLYGASLSITITFVHTYVFNRGIPVHITICVLFITLTHVVYTNAHPHKWPIIPDYSH